MLEILIIVCLLGLFVIFKLVVPQLFVRRALKPVIERFREHKALDEGSALSMESLGLGPLPLAERIMHLRDYKPKALEALVQWKIVFLTEEGKLYLSEEHLAESALGQQLPHLVQGSNSD